MAKFEFDSDAEFKIFMGDTIDYKNMQNIVAKLVSFINPSYIIEFGSGSGATSIRLAKENHNASVVAVDLREDIIAQTKEKRDSNKVNNLTLVNGDLSKLDNYNIQNVDVALLMYSFRYVEDKDNAKYNFLKTMYDMMQQGAYLIIGDTFIQDNATKVQIKSQLEKAYSGNGNDLFWNTLKSLDEKDINFSKEIQSINRAHTQDQIDIAINRKGVYHISIEWLIDTAKEIGYKIIINERLNNLSDGIIMLQK